MTSVGSFSQLDAKGNLKHFITLDGLPSQVVRSLLSKADDFFDPTTGLIQQNTTLQGRTVVNLFFEPSTRTRSTFELAAQKLGASVLNFQESTSATTKGESLSDTVKNLNAMQCDFFVVRHSSAGAAQFIASELTHSSVLNAGDGCHAHPTQALLDMYTIQKHRGDLKHLKVAIVGDVMHSRVARSQIQALNILQAKEVRLIGPKTLIPQHCKQMHVSVYHDLKAGLKGVDVIMMLRLQHERMQTALIPSSSAYFREFGLTPHTYEYANQDALIIHPGPINRDVEIDSDIADSENAVILDQVTNGIGVRMSVLSTLADPNNQIGLR